MHYDKAVQETIELIKKLFDISLKHWLDHEVFTWQWWLLVTVFLSSWIIFFRVVNRSERYRVLTFGFFLSIIALLFDIWGALTPLWVYPIRLIPIIPRLLPVDIGALPVIYMIIYYKNPTWKKYLICIVILAGVFAFIAEYLLILMGIYISLGWRHIYSFPIYIAMGIVGKLFADSVGEN